ncbi:uncharacterized protein LOC127443344 [Myxocyprinus asiaticus]|uniref:uncharacterized protein LOC127443344 n=1 Tax=Myxocyprinus asiaticus TaxID=70543 RepID=UPI0022226D41|nr:uncharacterized protein LOC127443344 [Myxocyprinus asiaticus]
MWKVFCLSVITVRLLDIGCAVKHTEINGYEEENLVFYVKYRSGYEENIKYFSRSDGFFEKKLVQTAQPNSWSQHGRYALFDNTTSRWVTIVIFRLGAEDSGLYYCGADVTLEVDPMVEIQITVKKGEPRRPTTEPRVLINGDDVITNPANIATQNWPKKRDQESYIRLVTVLSVVFVCTLVCVCPFVLFKVLKQVNTCKLSVSASYHTRNMSNQLGDEYVKMSPIVLPNSSTAQSDRASTAKELHRTTDMEAAPDTDTNYIDVDPVLSGSLDVDPLYSEMDVDSVQESVYQSINQTDD